MLGGGIIVDRKLTPSTTIADEPFRTQDRHPALTTRSMVEEDMREIARVIVTALSEEFEAERKSLLERSRARTERCPLYLRLSGFDRPEMPVRT